MEQGVEGFSIHTHNDLLLCCLSRIHRSINSKGSMLTRPPKNLSQNELLPLLAIPYQLQRAMALLLLRAAVLTTVSLKAVSGSERNLLAYMFAAEELGSSSCFLLPNWSCSKDC